MASKIPQWRVADRIGRHEIYEDPGRAFLRACELSGVDYAVDVELDDGTTYALVRRDTRHTIHVSTQL